MSNKKTIDALTLPTSDMAMFHNMIQNPGKCWKPMEQRNNALIKIKKDLVMSFVSDSSGVG